MRKVATLWPRWRVFFCVGDDARLGQLHHAVGEHLRVDAQVVLLFQEQQDSVGDGADAQLKGIPVPDQLGHVFARWPALPG